MARALNGLEFARDMPKKSTSTPVPVRGRGKIVKKDVQAALDGEIIPPGAEVDLLEQYIDGRLDKLERAYHLSSGGIYVPNRLSTGSLQIDLCAGGGIVPGSLTSYSGLEAASKSTAAQHTAACAVAVGLRGAYHDPEQSIDGEYSTRIFGVPQLSDVFGLPAADGAGWLQPPKIRYYDDNTLETFFDFTAAALRKLPDKRYHAPSDTWYYVFDKQAVRKDQIAEMGLTVEAELTKEFGHWYCPAAKRGAQRIVVCDSWPQLLSEDVDEDTAGDDKGKNKGSGGMAFNARKFSEYLPRVIGKLRRKAVILLGVNQIRLNPGARMGNPEYEPCGQALKFSSSLRFQFRAKTIPHNPSQWTEEEPAAFGDGTDQYQYKLVKNTKNKHGQPNLSCWVRVWTKDQNDDGRGYCPVWDTYGYYVATGRVSGNRAKFALNVANCATTLKGGKMTWLQFKRLVLASTKEQRRAVVQELGLKRWIDVRALAFAEMASGDGKKLLAAASLKRIEKPDDGDIEA